MTQELSPEVRAAALSALSGFGSRMVLHRRETAEGILEEARKWAAGGCSDAQFRAFLEGALQGAADKSQPATGAFAAG